MHIFENSITFYKPLHISETQHVGHDTTHQQTQQHFRKCVILLGNQQIRKNNIYQTH